MFLKWLFGSNNSETRAIIGQINDLESNIAGLTNSELLERSLDLRSRVKNGETLDAVLSEAFALVRESAKRNLGKRQYDVQMLGGIHIHRGSIVEMATGEGKTLSETAPAYLNALEGKGVHIITVNDYLARRDAVWMGQIYFALGLKTACIIHDSAYAYDPEYIATETEEEKLDEKRDETGSFLVQQKFLRPISRKEAYLADITYGTNSEFGFDYLRDNLAQSTFGLVQRGHNFAIIDEADSILIDEARTPLIISSPDESSSEYYKIMAKAVTVLNEGEDYTVDEKLKSVEITQIGIDKIEKKTGIANLYDAANLKLVHYLEESLKAKALFVRDRDYVVKEGEIIIVDQFTGRLMQGRRYSGGLHQAIEAKEGVIVKEESKTYAQITIQNYFRLYSKISGMTGTAQTSAEEFHKVYQLEVVTVPTNKPIIRKDLQDFIYRNQDAKFKAIVEEIKRLNDLGQPILVGTVSIEKNELLAKYLERAKVPFEILNAKNHEREGAIIAQAGRKRSVTLATNMAGRGVDIVLGGTPYNKEAAEEVCGLGGLHVIGTERHEARRIDNQLRGRAGRQGDPGSSQFFLSLDDDLMRIFGGDRLKSLMKTLNIPEDQPIESSVVSRAIIEAQKKVEGLNFDSRKHLLEYDDILNKQRTSIYRRRQNILEGDRDGLKAIVDGVLAKLQSEGEETNVKSSIERKLGEIGQIEVLRPALLSILDSLWMNHLEDLESLSETVKIRAYGQHDPLVEYRRESHLLYRNLLSNFENIIIDSLNHLEIRPAGSRETINVTLSEALPPLNISPSELAKIGRNDPCPCGSGKKFKHCHGR